MTLASVRTESDPKPQLTLVGNSASRESRMENPSAEDLIFYYGQTQTGKKVHAGVDLGSAVWRGRNLVIYTLCGNDLVIENPDRTLPLGRAREFCLRCFGRIDRNVAAEFGEMDPVGSLTALYREAHEKHWSRQRLLEQMEEILTSWQHARERIASYKPELTSGQFQRLMSR